MALLQHQRVFLQRLHQHFVKARGQIGRLALGKINEVFVGHGVTAQIKVGSNDDNLTLVCDLVWGRSGRGTFESGLLFTNLVDFDMVWGHRNDVDGFVRDAMLHPELREHPDDVR